MNNVKILEKRILDIIEILEKENFLISKIYKILNKEIEINKIINPNIYKSFKDLINLINNNSEKNKLKEISEQIQQYIPLKVVNKYYNMIIEKIFKLKINKKPKLINIKQTLSDNQIYESKIVNRKVFNILFINEEEEKDNNKINNYSIIMLYSIGNFSRGDTRCSISKFSLFPFKEKIKYKNISNNYTFSNKNLCLSKHAKNNFICFGNNIDFSQFNYILIYSIYNESPILNVEIKDKYILLKSILDNISFLYLSQDKEDGNFPGGNESGKRYIYLYNQKGDILYKENIGKIFHGPDHYCINTLCEYIKNKKIVVFLFQFATYNKQLKDKSYLLFYDLEQKSHKLLTNETFNYFEKDNNNEYYLLNISSNDDYLFSINSEKILQKWDCENCICIEKYNMNIEFFNRDYYLQLIKVNNDLSKLVIINIDNLCYYYKNKENVFVEITTIKIDGNERVIVDICNNINEENNNAFIIFSNKKFYIIQDI